MRTLDLASTVLGRQETAGSNRGPWVDKFRAAVSSSIASMPVPWCASFVFWVLRSTYGLTRSQLSEILGFEEPWYPESCDSWLQQSRSNVANSAEVARVVAKPEAGDLFLWMRRQALPGGKFSFSASDAIHIGFVVAPPLAVGARFATIEGNTCPEEDGDGHASREGDGVYHRSRSWSPGGIVWIGLPKQLKMIA